MGCTLDNINYPLDQYYFSLRSTQMVVGGLYIVDAVNTLDIPICCHLRVLGHIGFGTYFGTLIGVVLMLPTRKRRKKSKTSFYLTKIWL